MTPGDGDTTRPVGKVSTKLKAVVGLGDNELSMIKRITLISSVATESGENVLVNAGRVGAIVNVSTAGAATVNEPDIKLLVVFT